MKQLCCHHHDDQEVRNVAEIIKSSNSGKLVPNTSTLALSVAKRMSMMTSSGSLSVSQEGVLEELEI